MANTDEQTTPEAQPAPRRRRHGRIGLGMVATLSFAGILFTLLILSLSGRTIPIPEFVRASIENRINTQVGGAPLTLGGMRFGVGRDGIPRVLLTDIRLADLQGGAVAELNRIGAALSPGRLLRGEFAASQLALLGAQITIRRAADGSFAFRSDRLADGETLNLPDLLTRIDRIMNTGALASLQDVQAGSIVLTLEDARSGRIWQATNASAVLRNSESALTLSVASDVFNGTDQVAGMQLSLSRNRTTGAVSLGFTMTDMPAADIALQSPVLSWLGVLDAPISGAVRTELNDEGGIASFAGTLNIDAGALQPTAQVPPVEFDSAQAYFTFDPDRQRIDFTQVSVTSSEGSMTGTGHSYLSELDGPWPKAFLGQFQVDQLDYTGTSVFEAPISLKDIRADTRLRLDPFTVELAQVVVDNDGVPLRATGEIRTDDNGWQVAIDATTDSISSDRVLAFWPVNVSPITRGWLSRNLREGTVTDPAAAVRFQTGQEPDISLSFGFEGGTVRFLPNMPLLTQASGRATMVDHGFTLTVLEGGIDAETGGRVDTSGSVFQVPDVRPRPANGIIDVKAQGPLTGALSILNNRPLRLMERAKRPIDLAEADASVQATIRLPLRDKVTGNDVDYTVAANLRNVSSEKLVPGRVFAADALALSADNSFVGLDGGASLDGVPLTASWRQPLGDAARQGGTITGRVDLSQDTVQTFDLPLPTGLLRGQGQGDYRLTLPVDAPAGTFTGLVSAGTDIVHAVAWMDQGRQSVRHPEHRSNPCRSARSQITDVGCRRPDAGRYIGVRRDRLYRRGILAVESRRMAGCQRAPDPKGTGTRPGNRLNRGRVRFAQLRPRPL